MENGSIRICAMESVHLKDVVRIHLQSFPDFFLTFLGPRFLYLLYREILNTRGHVALVAMNNQGKLVGFVLGVTDQTGLYTRLARKRWFQFAFAATGAVMKKPSIVFRLFRAFRYSGKSRSASAQALLMSIAVLPEVFGQGVGKLLVRQFLQGMKKLHVSALCLTTDKDGNEQVNRFYEQTGFSIAKTYVTPEGRYMNEYLIDLTCWTEENKRA